MRSIINIGAALNYQHWSCAQLSTLELQRKRNAAALLWLQEFAAFERA